jgi:hypothetical protein
MSIEAGVLLAVNEEPIYWHLPPGRHGGALPDSGHLWKLIWDNRSRLWGFAHSHPGSGEPGPSYTDVTTFAAIEQALDKRLAWPIVTSDDWAIFRWMGGDRLDYSMGRRVDGSPTPEWVHKLRELSDYKSREMMVVPKDDQT